MIQSKVVLNDEQERAVYMAFEYLVAQRMRPFVGHGLAGTGKTTVLAEIAREVPHAIICTLTGKAASVLRRKTGLNVCTIHAAFYKLQEIERDKQGRKKLHFDTVHARGELSGKIVLIDECSMISHQMAMDIINTGAKIIAFGDPGQLPPIHGKPFFDVPDIVLETIHRQALESPIIRQAHAVRHDRTYMEDGNEFQVLKRPLTDQEILDADVILCYTNPTRQVINAHVRMVRGIDAKWPRKGEPVMCLKNAALYGVFNGAVYTLLRDFDEGDTSIMVDVDGVFVHIPMVFFEDLLPRAIPDGLDATTSFGFGYAMTVHKAMGSEWPNVILVDECFKIEVRREWLYTGITRAAERMIVSKVPIGYKPPPPLPF